MSTPSIPHKVNRRRALQVTAAGLAGLVPASQAMAQTVPAQENTVRDRFWIFTCPAGTDNNALKEAKWPQMSRMTPAESAFYLDVPNIMLIRVEGKPEIPFDQYAIPFRPMNRLVWSLYDSGGAESTENTIQATLDFAARTHNLTGFIMDDFFVSLRNGTTDHSPEKLRALRKRLVINGKRRDLYIVVYQSELHLPIQPYLEVSDKVTYWTWDAKDLGNLENDFARLEQIVPDRPKLLGCYFWDFGGKRPMPLDLMQKQCRVGLQWLKESRIEGMVFLANTVGDLDLPAVEWTRKWIAEVGDQPLAAKDLQPTR